MKAKVVLVAMIVLGLVGLAVHASSQFLPMAEVEVHVKDDVGDVVSNAAVSVYFERFQRGKSVSATGESDSNGVFRVKARMDTGLVFVHVGKEGHYGMMFETGIQDFPDKRDEYEKARKRDKWSGKPARIDILLKRVLEPKRLVMNWVDTKPFPAENGAFPIDLETLEWCPPFGNGRHEDVILSLETSGEKYGRPWFGKLSILMPNAADGFYVAKMDSRSDFPYPYRADTNAVYRKEGFLSVNRPVGEKIERHFPADDECLIFRVRTVTNAEGRVTSAHYGRIGEKPQFATGLKVAIWFNPDENDTNLEDGWH
jgi:hypothetical protein